MKTIKISFIIFLLFFTLELVTLSSYGVNWDAISHLARGQAYLSYYLTGKEDYSGNKDWVLLKQKEVDIEKKISQGDLSKRRVYFQKTDTILFSPDLPKDDVPRVSIYQDVGIDFQYTQAPATRFHYDYGHPHISDVLSSFFNLILFQKLGILNDIDAYRIYSVFLASMLVGLIFYWVASLHGKLAGLISSASLAFYPLFFAESHFNNEKDIPEMGFFSFMLFCVWKGIKQKSWRWLLTSGIFFGLALGTKFNILFAVFIIIPWVIFYLISKSNKKLSIKKFLKDNIKLIIAALMAPILGVLIVTITWPNFFEDPIFRVSQIVMFYKTIGTVGSLDQRFIGPLGVNTYPIQWIIVTTPLILLVLSFIGVVISMIKIKQKNSFYFLILLWFFIPILRVTWPGTNIYGGVRQIMEYIPAMAILAGIGANWLISNIKKQINTKSLNLVIDLSFVILILTFILIPIIKYHPYENVYFNELIGGLKGAKENNFPGWGVTFGSPYREAITWINNNAEKNAKLTLGAEILSNVPGIWIRPDIDYKSNRSGYLLQGEYVISLRFQGAENRSYFDMYLEKMINPIHEIMVDGVPILKIWKNDRVFLKDEWKYEKVTSNFRYRLDSDGIIFDLDNIVKLSRLELEYNEKNCPDLSTGYFTISQNGEKWDRIPGVLPEEVRIKTLGTQPSKGRFIEPFVGQDARFIKFYLSPYNTCVSNITSAKLFYF